MTDDYSDLTPAERRQRMKEGADANRRLFARARANVPEPHLDREACIQALITEGYGTLMVSGETVTIEDFGATADLGDLNTSLWDVLVLKEVARLELLQKGEWYDNHSATEVESEPVEIKVKKP